MAQQLGIFQGKKKLYNTLILKSLATGSKTTKQIAEYLYDNGHEKGTNRGNEVKKIYSVIDRAGGRLAELSIKGYIIRKNLLWGLSKKVSSFLWLYTQTWMKSNVSYPSKN